MGTFSPGRPIRAEELTVAQVLQGAGYATGHFGKWHLNGRNGERNTKTLPGRAILAEDPLSPGKLGFDEWVSADNFFDLDPVLGRKGVPEKFQGDGSDVTMGEALKFIRRQVEAGKPFLAVIWFGNPHVPHEALPADRQLYAGLSDDLQNYYGEITGIDRNVGRLRSALRELNAAENTLLCYCSDNGGAAGPRSTGNLRGSKGTLWEGGLRVPGLIEWPSRIRSPAVVDLPCSTLDLYPTILAATGVAAKSQIEPLDGVSLLPLLEGRMETRGKAIPFVAMINTEDSHAALLDWPWKLHTNPRSGNGKKQRADTGAVEAVMLFHVQSDPRETTNLAASEPERVAKMSEALLDWKRSVKRSLTGADYPASAGR
jgi:arylsulfatase A-like enzyme